MTESLLSLKEPTDYFKGVGHGALPSPTDVLLFLRTRKDKLQQEALQNRSHHRFVLIFNLGTPGQVHLDNLSLPFRPEESLLVHPYQFHHFSHLESNQLKWLFCTFELEPHQTVLEPLRNRTVKLSRKSRLALDELLNEERQPFSELQARQLQTELLRLFLSLLQDRQTTGMDLPNEPEDNLLRTVNRLMAEWRGRTVVVADLAESMGFSESYLRVLFRAAAGIPLGSYIQNYRINRAMALLRTTGLSITDLAEEAGFGSPQAFSRIFKKATGQTPRAYRLHRPLTPQQPT